MTENFEKTSRIVNGWWYTFEYHPTNITPGYDRYPMIFCIGPSTKDLNVFQALNLHHLPLKARIAFMVKFDKDSNFRQADSRTVYTADQLVSYFGAGLGIQGAIRYYNKKNIQNVYRVLNKAVPLYLEYDGDIMMKDPGTIMNKYLLDLGDNNKDKK
jgi:hypothetical protein